MKAVAIDLDGTLLNSKHKVSDFSKKILNHLHNKGVKIILASARPIQSVLNIAKEIGLSDIPMIGGNGAIIASDSKNIIYKNSIDEAEKANLFAELKRFPEIDQLTIHIYSDFNWFIPALTQKAQEEINIIGFSPSQTGENVFNIAHSVQKMMIVGTPVVLEKLKQYIELNLTQISCVFSKSDSLEINAVGVSKFLGVSTYAKLYQLSVSDVIAFGDGDNDEQMLKNCGIGVAMANATDLAKKAAAYLTKTNNEDGVAVFLQDYFKLSQY